MRARHYFRDTEHPDPARADRATAPDQVSYESAQEDSGWIRHTWTLMFSDGELDMMGVLDLFYTKPKCEEAERFIEKLVAAATSALFVPSDWNMTGP